MPFSWFSWSQKCQFSWFIFVKSHLKKPVAGYFLEKACCRRIYYKKPTAGDIFLEKARRRRRFWCFKNKLKKFMEVWQVSDFPGPDFLFSWSDFSFFPGASGFLLLFLAQVVFPGFSWSLRTLILLYWTPWEMFRQVDYQPRPSAIPLKFVKNYFWAFENCFFWTPRKP